MIANPGTVIAMIPECFPQGEVALDITEGKLLLLFDLREIQRANQEIVHAQDQGMLRLRFELGLGQRERDFWEIAEDRYHEQIGDPTLADGDNAHRIEMRGESMRKQRGEKGEK